MWLTCFSRRVFFVLISARFVTLIFLFRGLLECTMSHSSSPTTQIFIYYGHVFVWKDIFCSPGTTFGHLLFCRKSNGQNLFFRNTNFHLQFSQGHLSFFSHMSCWTGCSVAGLYSDTSVSIFHILDNMLFFPAETQLVIMCRCCVTGPIVKHFFFISQILVVWRRTISQTGELGTDTYRRWEISTKFSLVCLTERDFSEDLSVDGRIILPRILRK
jgi:hypothetical protein